MAKLIDCIVSHVRKSAEYNANARVAPACILWPDEKSEWLGVIEILKTVLPELYILGPYNPQERTGPSIWLKCVLDKAISDVNHPEDRTPVFYLPGVSYNTLRDTSHCPVEFQPLVELIYRGVCYRHPNNRDWSIYAFLSSGESLGLTVADDSMTIDALRRALPELLQCDIAELQDKTIDATFLNLLLQPDIPKSILQWIENPTQWQNQCTKATWQSFVDICEKEYSFNPEKDGPSIAADLLANSTGKWEQVWERFCDTPSQYKGVISRLSRCTFKGENPSHFPSENERLEKELESELENALTLNPKESIERINELKKIHSDRKSWVWFGQGLSPQLEFLFAVASMTEAMESAGNPPQQPDLLKSWYTEKGYKVDKAALNLGAVSVQFANISNAWIRHLYKPWLERCAEVLNTIIREKGYHYDLFKTEDSESTVLFFIDGLRYDTGSILLDKLTESGLDAAIESRWAPLPTVTATGKAFIAPVGELKGNSEDACEGFRPRLSSGAVFNENSLKTALMKNGWQYLSLPEFGNIAGKAWTFCGDLDTLGHTIGWKFVKNIPAELDEIVQQITQLFSMRWKKIKIVTDHGWLALPGGLPYTALSSGLTYDKSLRCALLKDGVTIDFIHLPWTVSDDVTVAYAPGISAFANSEYAHGGLSLQECIVPTIVINGFVSESKELKFEKIEWKGMRCRVTVSVVKPGYAIDIRLKPADKTTSVLNSTKKFIDGKNTVSIAVEIDDSEGKEGYIVLLDEKENVLIETVTTIGG